MSDVQIPPLQKSAVEESQGLLRDSLSGSHGLEMEQDDGDAEEEVLESHHGLKMMNSEGYYYVIGGCLLLCIVFAALLVSVHAAIHHGSGNAASSNASIPDEPHRLSLRQCSSNSEDFTKHRRRR